MNGCFAGIMMGVACDRWGLSTAFGSPTLGLIVCILIGIASGALIGAINGLMTTRFKLSSWITTLATQFICKGLVTTISQGITLDIKALGTKAVQGRAPALAFLAVHHLRVHHLHTGHRGAPLPLRL